MTEFKINTSILINAVNDNLHPHSNADTLQLALSALGFDDLAHRISSDLIRLAAVTKLDNDAAGDDVENFMAGKKIETSYSNERERRQIEFWESVAEVRKAIGTEAA